MRPPKNKPRKDQMFKQTKSIVRTGYRFLGLSSKVTWSIDAGALTLTALNHAPRPAPHCRRKTFTPRLTASPDLNGDGLGLTYASINTTDVRTEDASTIPGSSPACHRSYTRVAWARDFLSNPSPSEVVNRCRDRTSSQRRADPARLGAHVRRRAELFFRPRWTLAPNSTASSARIAALRER